MSVAEVRPGPAAAVDAGASVDAVLERLHWTVLAFRDERLGPGAERRHSGAGIRFYYVADGVVVLCRTGDETLRVQAGDFLLLPRGGDLTVRATVATRLLSGTLGLRGAAGLRAHTMPAVLFTCGFRMREPAYAALLEAMEAEVSRSRDGVGQVGARVADVVASAAIRTWLEAGCGRGRRWLAAMNDPYLARVIDAIHDDPGSPWTVESLARLARSSRSQFAEQFKGALGDTPARYLTRVRMELAERMLRDGASVTDVAYRLGYQSDAGFSRAFRRHTGVVPSRWRRTARGASV